MEEFMRIKSVVLFVCLAELALFASVANAAGPDGPGDHERTVSVMTRNLDAGSDFGYVIQAASDPNTTQLQLLMAITNTYQEMTDSNIPKRAKGIAEEVFVDRPALIGLQEVTTLRTGAYGMPATTVVVDGLQ